MADRLPPTPESISRAAALLRDGKLVAFGTETVYGLGADATNSHAVAAIFAVKNRPSFNPLICHYPDADAAFRDVLPTGLAHRLAAALWPGPLTIVLPRRPDSHVALLTAAGLDTLAIRLPSHPIAQALLQAAGRPVAAPSANPSGRISPTTAQHVLDGLNDRIAAVLDIGPCQVGLESTVLDLTSAPTLLRPGGTPVESIEAITGPLRNPRDNNTPRSPGMLASHYAPNAPLRINATGVAPDETLLAFGTPIQGAAATLNLSPTKTLLEAAANLFAALRTLDAIVETQRLRGIAAMPIPETGLGLAINDRLRRAAAPRRRKP